MRIIIVPIVIAIAVLIFFASYGRTWFGMAASLQIPGPDYTATSEEQIVLPTDHIEFPSKRGANFKASFFNNYDSSDWQPDFNCNTYVVKSEPQQVPYRNAREFQFLVEKTDFTGMEICTLTFTNNEHEINKQIVLEGK